MPSVAAVAPRQRPIRLAVRDDGLRRSRLTVFFRFLLVLPHLVWLLLWGIAASVAAFVLWLAILIEGRAPLGPHGFVAGYLRYATHVGAYLFIAANPFPGFRGSPGYAVDLEIDPPARQNRWTAAVRFVLALPALVLAAVLGSGLGWSGASGVYVVLAGLVSSTGVAGIAAFLVWCAALVRGRAPAGLRDLIAYALGYGAQAGGYLLLLTDRYPSSDPALLEPVPRLPEHPVRIRVTDDLERSRITVLLRFFLALPHLVWLALWSFAAVFAVITAWFAALVSGQVPGVLHRFLASYVRYSTHVVAYLTIMGRKFPGFLGRAGSYGIDLEIEPPRPQSRWLTLFRLFVAIPAGLLAGALGNALWVAAFLAWWSALARGRMPEGLRNLGAVCLRYNAQTYAYLALLSDRYPYASPVLEGARKPRETFPPYLLPGDPF
jgi:hypothetical protein